LGRELLRAKTGALRLGAGTHGMFLRHGCWAKSGSYRTPMGKLVFS
jgi:hypothetical protein